MEVNTAVTSPGEDGCELQGMFTCQWNPWAIGFAQLWETSPTCKIPCLTLWAPWHVRIPSSSLTNCSELEDWNSRAMTQVWGPSKHGALCDGISHSAVRWLLPNCLPGSAPLYRPQGFHVIWIHAIVRLVIGLNILWSYELAPELYLRGKQTNIHTFGKILGLIKHTR